MLPDGLLAGLHDSRSVSESRAAFHAALADLQNAKAQIAELTRSEQKLQETNAALGTRFDGFVQQAGGVRTRIEKLEQTLPKIVAALAPMQPSDPTVITGSIGQAGRTATSSFDAPGGSVTVSQSPLVLPVDPDATDGGMNAAQFHVPPEAMPAMPGMEHLPLDWPRLQ
jgi:hypothetical protein